MISLRISIMHSPPIHAVVPVSGDMHLSTWSRNLNTFVGYYGDGGGGDGQTGGMNSSGERERERERARERERERERELRVSERLQEC